MDQLVPNINEAVRTLAWCIHAVRDLVPKTTFSFSGLLKRSVNPSKFQDRLFHDTFAYCVYENVEKKKDCNCEVIFNMCNNMFCEEL